MILVVLFFWVLFCLLAAAIFGSNRTCGFWGSFAICFFTSPLLGFIITLLFPTLQKEQIQQQMLHTQKQMLMQQQNALSKTNVSDEIAKLKQLKDEGTITEDEFEAQKKKLLS